MDDEARMRAVKRHIKAHLDSDLRLSNLADRAGMSMSSFSRWFRAREGITPHAYVIDARIERAQRLLTDTRLSLVDVALAVGFSSQACLNVAFRKRVGMTPAQYRAGTAPLVNGTPRARRRSGPDRR